MGALDEQMKEIRAMLEAKERPEDDDDDYGLEEDSDEDIKERINSLEKMMQENTAMLEKKI
jgi:hypothetical protein